MVIFLLSKQTLFLTHSNLCSIWYNSAHISNKPFQGWRFSVLCSQDIDSVSKYVYIVCVTFSKTSRYLWELIYLHICMFMKVTPLWREAIRQGMTFALKNHQFLYEHLFWCVDTCTHMCMLHTGVNTIACNLHKVFSFITLNLVFWTRSFTEPGAHWLTPRL